MSEQEHRRVLVVANRTAATPQLLAEVRRRAREAPCAFALLIPDAAGREAGDWTLQHAIPLLEQAAGTRVRGLVGGPDPLDEIRRAIGTGEFDEVIVSTLPRRVSRWLRRDLPRRVEAFGLPVTVITSTDADPTVEAIRSFKGGWSA